MTRALYFENGTQLDFESTVVAVQPGELALAATAFYPEGGGQRGDSGVLRWNGTEVIVSDTRKDKASGTIWHVVKGEVPAEGATVQGRVDPGRRWRHMQRHTGEHLLAQAFKRLNPEFQVVAVSMNSPECHLDLLGDPTDADAAQAEGLLREALGRDELVLQTPIVPETDLGKYPLRRETKVTGEVRLVIFKDAQGHYFDVSACGGTHVPRAAMCAPVVVLRTERIKGGLTRVTFMAGEEASAYLSGVYRASRALGQQFSVPVEKLAERVQALGTEKDALKTELERVRGQLAAHLVRISVPEMVDTQPVHFMTLDDEALLLPVLSGVDAGEIIVALTPSGRCGISSGTPDFHAGNLLREVLGITGGKGGGKADLAQGTTADPASFLEVTRSKMNA